VRMRVVCKKLGRGEVVWASASAAWRLCECALSLKPLFVWCAPTSKVGQVKSSQVLDPKSYRAARRMQIYSREAIQEAHVRYPTGARLPTGLSETGLSKVGQRKYMQAKSYIAVSNLGQAKQNHL
jgi:hypothetical protein